MEITKHITAQSDKTIISFGPRPSHGWLWLLFMAAVIAALGIAPVMASGLYSGSAILTLVILIPVALAFLVLAVWFPTMRYDLDGSRLTLHYGPVLAYRIDLVEIQTIRRKNLSLTIWSAIRFPGIALFGVPYGDVGTVKMCATAALNNILLIETAKEKYGLTPEDEAGFVAALRARMES